MTSLIATIAAIPSFFLAAETGGANPVTTISLGVGATTVVTVMAWIVRKVVAGEVVPVPIAELLEAQKTTSQKQDRILEQLLAERVEYRNMVRGSTEANFAVYEFLRSSGWSLPATRPGTSAHAEKVHN